MNANSLARVFGRILLATDFSECSTAILPYAASLARSWNSTLFLAHVVPGEIIAVEPPVVLSPRQPAERKMRELEASYLFDGIEHTSLIAEGLAADTLLQMAEENEIDLILMGTHGRTGFRKLVMGSVAERVFRHANCPVLTIGPHAIRKQRREARINTIVCALGELFEEHPALRRALAIAAYHGASLVLIHVVPASATASFEIEAQKLRKQLVEIIPCDIALARAPETVVETGTPSECIVKAASQRHADLIILGALPPAMLSAHLMDTAYRVMVEASCPVMTVLETHDGMSQVTTASHGH